MGYQYESERNSVFTEEGQRTFLAIRDNVHDLLDKSGAVRMQEAIRPATGMSWTMLACVDRLVELGEIREITNQIEVFEQDRVFVRVDQ